MVSHQIGGETEGNFGQIIVIIIIITIIIIIIIVIIIITIIIAITYAFSQGTSCPASSSC